MILLGGLGLVTTDVGSPGIPVFLWFFQLNVEDGKFFGLPDGNWTCWGFRTGNVACADVVGLKDHGNCFKRILLFSDFL